MGVRAASFHNNIQRIAGLAVAGLILLATVVASAAETVPVLWTAGGLDSGSSGAGQAGRICVDATGNVAVVSGGAGGSLLAVTSYTPDGVLRWQRTVRPNSGTFTGDWVAAAPNSDIVAMGHSVDSRGRPIQLTLVRYTTDGTLLWRVDSPDLIFGIARLLVDAGGNSYVAFNSQVNKYDAGGRLQWTQTMSAGTANSLALGPGGSDVVVVGAIRGGASWVGASIDTTTGARRWEVNSAEGIGARDVVVDASRVYVTGQGNVGTSGFLTVIAYDRASGARLWRTDATPPGNQSVGLRIALAPDGSLAASGYASGGGYLDWWTVAMTSSGTVIWQARRDLALTGDETPSSVFVLSDGTTVVSGTGGPVVRDILGNSYMQGVTAGYSQTGALLWEGFSKLGTVWATALPNGDVCATGGYDALVTCWRVGVPPTPPNAPTGLTGQLVTGSIELAWQDNSTNETAFSVERSYLTGAGWTNFAVIATLPTNTVSYRDTTYQPATTNNYRVRATNGGGDSAYSNVASVVVLGTGDPPKAVMSATPSTGTSPLTVNFDGSQSSPAFGTITSWAWVFGDGAAGTGATTTHVYTTPGTYTATLTVTSNSGGSGSTSVSIAVTAPQPPTAPTALTATALSRSSIGLNWTNTAISQTQVQIERCQGSGCTSFTQIAAVAGTATTFTDTGLKSRKAYTYRVRASSAAGVSAYSASATATTQ